MDAEELEAEFPFEAIPYIFVFDENVETIELRLRERHATYMRAGSEELDTGGCLTVIEGVGSADHFIVHQENGILRRRSGSRAARMEATSCGCRATCRGYSSSCRS